jgi:hypothetical protein
MNGFEERIWRTGFEVELFIGTGYARFACRGIEFIEWVLQPWTVEELEEKWSEEQEE